MKIRLPALLLLFASVSGYAQSLIPLERSRNLYIENYNPLSTQAVHTAIKPLFRNEFAPFADSDSVMMPGGKQYKEGRSWIIRKLFSEHFLKADTADFFISADPLFDIQAGRDMVDNAFVYRNSRGLQIQGGVTDKLAFYTSYLETQARFQGYVNDYVGYYNVVPGMCLVKDFKGNAWDYGVAAANVSFTPLRHLNIQLGYGKNFFGDGYRSLLLSDNSFQYPFLKLTGKFGRIEYVSMFASFQNLSTDSVFNEPYVWYGGYQKKPATFHYISIHVAKWLQLGLFEGVVWESRGVKDAGFNINQFIPVILLNTFRYSLFGGNNVVLGLNANARPHRDVHIYGQWVVDDFHFNKPAGGGYQKDKYGFQIGAKYFHVAGVRNLILQAEYNQMRPYTYGHSNPLQSYTHYNQALAHPLGANFREVAGFIDYRYRRVFSGIQMNYARSGADDPGMHYGGNIFLSDRDAAQGYASTGNVTGQGGDGRTWITGIKLGYLFNPKYNLSMEAGMWARNHQRGSVSQRSTMIWVGFRTNLFNQYFDF